MNTHTPKRVLGGAGFYTVLLLCLAAVGIFGWFLLFDKNTANTDPGADSSQQETVSQLPDTAAESEPPAVETVQGAELEEKAPAVSMPEEKVDDTPVVAQQPHLVVSPLNGDVVAAFSMDKLQYDQTLGDWRTHDGIDIAAAQGTSVLAACSGTVLSVADDPLMGTTVVLSHDGGYQTTYANLQAKPTVKKGDKVSAGQIIGAVGTTSTAEAAEGPHLHFSVTKDGDAVNPADFLKR